MNDVLPKFLEFWSKRDNKDETTKVYGTKIRHFVELVGNLPLNKITSKVVREYKEKYLHIPNRRELNRIRKDAINTARELQIANEENQVRTPEI